MLSAGNMTFPELFGIVIVIVGTVLELTGAFPALLVALQWGAHYAMKAVANYRWSDVYTYGKSKNNHYAVTSKKHLYELSESSEFSIRAVYSDIFGLKHTLHKLNPNEHSTMRYRTFGRILSNMHPARFERLAEHLQPRVHHLVSAAMTGTTNKGWVELALAPFIKELVNSLMIELLYGETLAYDPEFKNNLLSWHRDVLRFSGYYMFTPEFLAGFVYNLVSGSEKHIRRLFDKLVPVCAREPGTWSADPIERDSCVLGLFLESTENQSYWTALRSAQALVGISFAALHQPWTAFNYVVYELCSRFENIEPIREELVSSNSASWAVLDDLPLLNSFIKENLRFLPGDKLAVRRKALKPFTFTDEGPHVPAGGIACTPLWRLMREPDRYTDGDVFEARRFLPKHGRVQEQESLRITEVSDRFLTWGYGSLACPGRWHVAFIYKILLRQLILNYDFELLPGQGPKDFDFYTFNIPNRSLEIRIRPRRPRD